MNIIYILWLRQLKRYFRSKARIIGSLAQPLLFLVALGFGFGPIFQKAGGGNYMEFLAPGIISMSILFTAIFAGIEVIWDKQFGFLKETLVAPVSRVQIMFGRTLGGATVATLQGLIVFILSVLIGFEPISLVAVPLSILFMFMIALIFTALGTAIASALDDMQGFQLIMNFLVMPLFFLSGALFPLSGLPPIIKTVASIDPLSYGVDSLRGALTGVYHFGFFLDFAILGALIVIFIWLGSYMFRRIQI
ncbi:MAG: ABC transporter permease [Candidatus Paceibacterota bacterium]|jgi:ABC-2 type transport system permease protein